MISTVGVKIMRGAMIGNIEKIEKVFRRGVSNILSALRYSAFPAPQSHQRTWCCSQILAMEPMTTTLLATSFH